MKRSVILIFVLVLSAFPMGEEEAIENYLNKIGIGDPIAYKNLKIFPLTIKTPITLQEYITLDQAMDRGWLKIKEVGSGEVNFVEVKNTGKDKVFVLTGEMVTGAKQDRMIKEDVLLPPYSGWVKIPVYCVEHGRWTEVSHEFKSGGYVVPNMVRKSATITQSQTEVWDRVAESQSRLGIASGTGTVRANYEDKRINEEIVAYTEYFEMIPRLNKSTIGVVVTTGNRIICLDMFANNSLLNKLWKKLVKSYAVDAIVGERSTVDKDDIIELLEAIKDAKFVSNVTPGLGKFVEIASHTGSGSALISQTAVIHMDFFLNDGIIDTDSGLRLDFRRGQRLGD